MMSKSYVFIRKKIEKKLFNQNDIMYEGLEFLK